MINREELIKIASGIEAISFVEHGRGIDGAPYETFDAMDFFKLAFTYFGQQVTGDHPQHTSCYALGEEFIISKVKERKKNGEPNANPNCGNWWLWTIFNELGVSRVRE